MRNLATLALVFIFMAMTGCGRAPSASGFDGQMAYDYAATQVGFGPRYPGSLGHAEVQMWIQETLEGLGWAVETQSFTHLEVELTNIIARLPDRNDGPSPIILGTHYDTRPQADQDPYQPLQPVVGANDGASGVAVLLEMARILQADPPEIPVWLIFFDGEDSGNLNGWDWIIGSSYFADNMTVSPRGVIIVDMVGDQDLQLYFDRNSNPQLLQEVWNVAEDLGYRDFIPQYKHAMIDDHTPFNRLGIPAIDIIDFDYPAWHTIEDTLDQISAESLEKVGNTLIMWLTQQTD